MELLLDHGANTDITVKRLTEGQSENKTALLIIIASQDLTKVKNLIKYGASVDTSVTYGFLRTSLQLVTERGTSR